MKIEFEIDQEEVKQIAKERIDKNLNQLLDNTFAEQFITPILQDRETELLKHVAYNLAVLALPTFERYLEKNGLRYMSNQVEREFELVAVREAKKIIDSYDKTKTYERIIELASKRLAQTVIQKRIQNISQKLTDTFPDVFTGDGIK